MDARASVAARAVALCVAETNNWACSDNVRMRGAVERARLAIHEGDRGLALQLLAEALGEEPPPPPAPGLRERRRLAAIRAHWHACSMCGQRVPTVFWMQATGRWRNLPQRQRQLCTPCYNVQP